VKQVFDYSKLGYLFLLILEARLFAEVSRMAKEKTMTAMSVELGDKAWGAIAQRKFEEMLERDMGKTIEKTVRLQYEYCGKYYSAMMNGKKLSAAETKEFEKKMNEAMEM